MFLWAPSADGRKGSAFPFGCSNFCGGSASDGGIAAKDDVRFAGKAEPFRSSGGKAGASLWSIVGIADKIRVSF